MLTDIVWELQAAVETVVAPSFRNGKRPFDHPRPMPRPMRPCAPHSWNSDERPGGLYYGLCRVAGAGFRIRACWSWSGPVGVTLDVAM